MDRRSFPSAVTGDTTARLERIEQAIDAISLEVERISEGQRFTTKLLADRAQAQSLGKPEPSRARVITPH